MAVIDTFINILSPLKIYELSKNTKIYKELQAYSKEFDLYAVELDTLLKECFIVTAEDYGLSIPERVYTAPYENEDPELRRQRILNRLNLNDSCFTLEEIKKAITDFGAMIFQILEFPERYSVVVEIYGDYEDAQIDFMKSEIKKLMPAHLKTEVYFNGITWSAIDSKALSFDTMDGKNYSWNSIDEFKI